MNRHKNTTEPDNTAVRTALWRALHVQVDAKPHILEDEIGLKLIAPPDYWMERPDMKYTRRLRASIVARSRFIEDLIIAESKKGIDQYVTLGAGLDTFVQRRPDFASKLQIYEIDQPGTLTWKQKRLADIGLAKPNNLHFVSVDFEMSSWWKELLKSGFDLGKPAVVACTGVTLYLSRAAIIDTLSQIAKLASGSTLAMAFYLPIELLDEEDKAMQEIAEKGARAAGTPFESFFTPQEVLDLAHAAQFKEAKTISTKDMEQLYFTDRADGLFPASGEVFLLATT
ncbi:methyltransferase (TIGR00027 family) [Pedobacter sp. W3I1]|uniref:class I SAM-dependent methyltransferase n=1 Tax=Pedobacter sp. W3I1 TaxID=3042291 RepID=UPI00278589A6|nr:class I SAM-dependent methyltransferase [Pedobacter sp. W3I1]MDQ0641505.1 methyltransferase (TIGR00027 family) [Pedobacter sp. W3I1]